MHREKSRYELHKERYPNPIRLHEKINRLEFYKERYEKELETKEMLSNRYISNLSLLTFIVAGLAFCIKNVHNVQDTKIFPYFLFSLGIAILSVITLIVMYFLVLPKETHVIGSPEDLEEYHLELVTKHYSRVASIAGHEERKKAREEAEEEIEQEFSEALFITYVEATTHNAKMNMKRHYTLGYSTLVILIAIVGTLLSLACYVPTFFKDSSEVQKVEVIYPKVTDEKKE